jgi:hypothetical protein
MGLSARLASCFALLALLSVTCSPYATSPTGDSLPSPAPVETPTADVTGHWPTRNSTPMAVPLPTWVPPAQGSA